MVKVINVINFLFNLLCFSLNNILICANISVHCIANNIPLYEEWGYSLEVDHLPSKWKALSSILNSTSPPQKNFIVCIFCIIHHQLIGISVTANFPLFCAKLLWAIMCMCKFLHSHRISFLLKGHQDWIFEW